MTDPNHDHDPVSKIMLLDSFTKAWDVFVGHFQETILVDHSIISSPALRCVEKAIKAAAAAEGAHANTSDGGVGKGMAGY